MLKLIDAAHYQGEIDFDALIADGVSGVIVKATEGRAPTVDSRFAENWAALGERRGQLVRGAYAFARPNTDGGGAEDGRAEAEHFCHTVLETGTRIDEDFIAALDFEKGGTDPDHSPQQNLDFIAAWEETCVKMLDRSPLLYTGKNTWQNCCAWSSEFVHLPLWVARYASAPPVMPWPKHTLWQYTGSGRVDGINGDVDINEFDGTIEQLRELERPHIYAPAQSLGIHAPFDLAALDSSVYDPRAALVQGMLLAHGFGPSGLVGSDGLPDGKAGAKTEAALSSFRERRGLGAGTAVSGGVWYELAVPSTAEQ